MKPADSALLRAWIDRRDAEAFAQIVRRYAGLVYGSAHRILSSSADAEDVSQECFLALAGADGPGPRSLPAWLHAVATRQALKRVRGDRARERRESAHAKVKAEQIDPAWDDIKSYVDEAIEELPEDLRYAVTAHFLLQRTHRNIAHELDLTRQAVSYRIGKGVEEIRRGLKRRGISAPAALLGTLLGAHAHAAAPSELTASLGKLAIAGTRGRDAVLVHTSTALRTPLLRWSALVLVTLSLAGTSVVLLRPEERPGGVSPVLLPPAPAEAVAPIPKPVATEASAVEPDPPPALMAESEKVERPNEESDFDRLVSGRVYDLDTGLPVADATVVAEYRARRRLPSGISVTSIHTQQGLTDSMGIFQIASLRPKKYTLRVYMELRDLVDEGTEADLRSRDELRGVDIGVSLEEPDRARIEGLVTRGGSPVVGGTIQVQYDPIQRVGTEDSAPRGPGNAISGRIGEYVLREMPEGTAVLTLVPVLGFHGRLTQFVDVEPGEIYVVDFDIPVNAGGGIEGWIVPPPATDGALVRAYTDNRDGISIQWTAATTPDGHYRFFGLPEGVFEVVVETDTRQGYFITSAPVIASSPEAAILALISGDRIIRVASGLWTRLYNRLRFNHNVGPEGWTYPPRQYFASYADGMEDWSTDFVANGNYGSDFVTVEADRISKLDFDFGAGDSP